MASYISRRAALPAGVAMLFAAALVATFRPAAAAGATADPPGVFLALLAQARSRSTAADWPAAARSWSRVVEINPVEAEFWHALAEARDNLHDWAAAIAAHEHAFALGHGALGHGTPAETAFALACDHARLGERDQAFTWLGRALALGYTDLDRLRSEPALAALRADPRFAALIPYPADPAGLSRREGWRQDLRFLLWQIDRLAPAPYRLHPRPWFEQQFAALAASADDRSDAAMALALLGIMRGIGDGHSGVMHGMSLDWALTLPLQFHAFDDGVYILAAAPAYRELLGARLIDYGGRPVAEIMAALAAGVSRDNDGPWVELQASARLRYVALLAGAGIVPEHDGARLHLRLRDGSERTVRVAADTSQPDIWNMRPNPPQWLNLGQVTPGAEPLYLRHPERNYWAEYLPAERTIYVGLNAMRDEDGETLAQFSDRLAALIAAHRVNRLAIDLRWNNGGNTALFPRFLAAVLRSDKVNRPGRLFVLIGGRTFSAAQNAASLLERFTNATFVGEPTGSSPNFIGEEKPFTLPYSRLVVNVSNLAWQSQYPQDHRTWIAPTFYVPPTFAAYRAKRDPAMEAVLRWPLPAAPSETLSRSAARSSPNRRGRP